MLKKANKEVHKGKEASSIAPPKVSFFNTIQMAIIHPIDANVTPMKETKCF